MDGVLRLDQQTKNESKKSTGRDDGGPYSSTNSDTSSGRKTDAKTLVVFEYDETLKIKEEITQDQERRQEGEHSLLFERNLLDEKSIITSDNNSGAKTLLEYDLDETLEIKEEIVQDQETVTSQKGNKKLCTIDTREVDILSAKKLQNLKKQKIQESKQEQEDKYKCEKSARSYKQKCSLHTQNKHECDVMPQFSCKCCGERFKRKFKLNSNIVCVYQETISNQKKKTIQESKQEPEKKYKCEKCARCYMHKNNLNFHKKYECYVTPQFKCNLCTKQFKQKVNLNYHIVRVHQETISNQKKQKIQESKQETENKYNCGKCARSYKYKRSLNSHQKYECDVRPHFSCELCAKHFKHKSSIRSHIVHMHRETVSNQKKQKIRKTISNQKKQNIQEAEKKYKCGKCARSYKHKASLNSHQKYACDVRPQFRCELCSNLFQRKASLNRHIVCLHQETVSNQKKQKIQETERKFICGKCARSYKHRAGLNTHQKYECDAMPQFRCELCAKLFKRKTILKRHITGVHLEKTKIHPNRGITASNVLELTRNFNL